MFAESGSNERGITHLTFSEKIWHTISRHKLLDKEEKILVAVSGGMDSMALLHFLYSEGFKLSVAHCNYKLRDEDSDKDEELVKDFCSDHGIQFFSESFNTESYCRKNKLSIQEGARKLRYRYFDEIKSDLGIDKVCTAHHLDDSIETYFINMLRGAGLKGQRGIPVRNNYVVRPFIEVSKPELEEYIKEHEIPYREDLSNLENKYLRNNLRNDLIPIIAKIYPAYRNVFRELLDYNKLAWAFVEEEIEDLKESFLKREQSRVSIDLSALDSYRHSRFLLFHLMQDFHFTPGESGEILNILESEPGRRIIGESHVVLKDRDQLIIERLPGVHYLNVSIDQGVGHIKEGVELNISEYDIKEVEIDPNLKLGFFDLDKIKFPLHIRNWKKGDRFIPLGMNEYKKLSDFFIDEKIDVFEKHRIPILTSGGEIMWVMGHRVSNVFKVEDSTSRVLKITWLDEQ